jgi:hypothetical protein
VKLKADHGTLSKGELAEILTRKDAIYRKEQLVVDYEFIALSPTKARPEPGLLSQADDMTESKYAKHKDPVTLRSFQAGDCRWHLRLVDVDKSADKSSLNWLFNSLFLSFYRYV